MLLIPYLIESSIVKSYKSYLPLNHGIKGNSRLLGDNIVYIFFRSIRLSITNLLFLCTIRMISVPPKLKKIILSSLQPIIVGSIMYVFVKIWQIAHDDSFWNELILLVLAIVLFVLWHEMRTQKINPTENPINDMNTSIVA